MLHHFLQRPVVQFLDQTTVHRRRVIVYRNSQRVISFSFLDAFSSSTNRPSISFLTTDQIASSQSTTNLSSPVQPIAYPLDNAESSANNNNDSAQDELVRRESIVWKYATRNIDNQTATCLLCSAVIKTTSWSTTGLRKHLVQVHKVPNIPPSVAVKKATFSPALRRELHELVMKAIIQDSRSFNDFRRPGMIKFLRKAVPGKYSISHDERRAYFE